MYVYHGTEDNFLKLIIYRVISDRLTSYIKFQI